MIKEQRADGERSDGCGNKCGGEEMSDNFLCCWADGNVRLCSQTFGVQEVSVPFNFLPHCSLLKTSLHV